MKNHTIDTYNTLIEGFPNISRLALRALRSAGFVKLEHLTGASEKALSELHGMGPKALGILRQALEEKGLAFKEA